MQSLTTRGMAPFSPLNPIRSSNGTPKVLERTGTGSVILRSYLRFSLANLSQTMIVEMSENALINRRRDVDLGYRNVVCELR